MSIMKTGEEFYAPILCIFKYAAHQLGEICYLDRRNGAFDAGIKWKAQASSQFSGKRILVNNVARECELPRGTLTAAYRTYYPGGWTGVAKPLGHSTEVVGRACS